MFERREKGRRDAADRERAALKKQAIEIAKNLLSISLPIEQIVKATGLTREEVEALSKTK
jgi:predicted transposase YdaD